MSTMKLFNSAPFLLLLSTIFFTQELYSQSSRPDTSAIWLTGSNYWNFAGYNVVSYDPEGKYNGANATSYKVDQYWYGTSTQLSHASTVNHFGLGNREGVVFLYMEDPYIQDPYIHDTLYNFNADIGDSWTFEGEFDTKLTVTGKGTIEMNGQELKYSAVDLTTELTNIIFEEHDTIVERIGFLHRYFLPYDVIREGLDRNEGGPTRCYYDDVLDYVPFSSYSSCGRLESLGSSTLSLDFLDLEVGLARGTGCEA